MASCERNVAWMSASSRHGLVLWPHGPCLSTAPRLSSSTPCGSRESSSCRPSSSIKLCPSFIHGTLPVFIYCMSSVLVHHKGFLWLEHGPCDQGWTSLGAWWEVMDRWCCIAMSARAVLSTRHVHLSLNKRLNVKVKMSLSYFSFSFLSYSLFFLFEDVGALDHVICCNV